MALRCVRVAMFALLLISFAPLMGQPTAHAQTPTPTATPNVVVRAPVADCIAKCPRPNKVPFGDFLTCIAACTNELPKPTRKPTSTPHATRTPIPPVCCQCGGGTNVPSCFGTSSPEGCVSADLGCVAKPGFVCGLDGHCAAP